MINIHRKQQKQPQNFLWGIRTHCVGERSEHLDSNLNEMMTHFSIWLQKMTYRLLRIGALSFEKQNGYYPVTSLSAL